MADSIYDLLLSRIPEAGKVDPYEIYGFLYHNKGEVLTPLIRQRILEAQARGLTRACPNPGKHRLPPIAVWDKGVREGFENLPDHAFRQIVLSLSRLLAQAFQAWTYDPTATARMAHPTQPVLVASILEDTTRVEVFTEDHVPQVAAILDLVLIDPTTPLYEGIDVTIRSAADNRMIQLMWKDWTPFVATKEPDGPLTILPETPALPAIRHYELPVSDRLLAFSSSDCPEPLMDALHTVSTEEVGLGDGFSSDAGVNLHIHDVHAACGILEIQLGDHFPCMMSDIGILRGTTEPEEGLPPGVTYLTRFSLDEPAFGSYADILALVSTHEDVASPEAARQLIDAAIEAGDIVEISVGLLSSKVLHLYVPDGWRADDFDAEITRLIAERGLLTEIPGEMTYFVLSAEPLDIPEEFDTHARLG